MATSHPTFLPPTALPHRTTPRHLPHLSPLCPPLFAANKRHFQRSLTPCATLQQDFLAGPQTPPYPRPLAQVILFSSLTGLLWYGWYKFCVEEDLRATTGEGPGGVIALGPFVAGVLSPLFLPTGGYAELGVSLGVLWIVVVQYSLYRRINRVCEKNGLGRPLVPEWIVLPGFNLLVGLRSIHFLSLCYGAEKGTDWFVERLPFLGVPTLGVWQMITTPRLWIKF